MKANLIVSVLAVSALGGLAHAEMVFGLPITMTQNGTVATAVFSVGRAAWTGILYRNDGTAGLGQFMFNNKSARAGDLRALGTLNAGDEMWFNYKVITGSPAIYRGDSPGGAIHFGFEQINPTTVTVRVEDMPMGMSDRDWDDCVAIVRFSKPVRLGGGGGGEGGGGESAPTPGVLVCMMGGAAGVMGRRRRG
jgi:hypothetical protein